ncbi:TetR/AcrR family transcriptional regulator [Microbacteriaceae bacterium VKM Ac-2855]|nr:TetR/AcrR family transcriptional regulator [Microbacteriaceae bacterium VKM Ac-2855]
MDGSSDADFVVVRTRARPLEAEERRAEIIRCTIPLLLEQGRNVTTARIAIAAGVAEGTLYRVFSDKDALIDAAVEAHLDAKPVYDALDDVDRTSSLEDRVTAVAEILQQRFRSIVAMMTAMHIRQPPPRGHGIEGRPPFLDLVAALLAPNADRLSVAPERAAQIIRLLTFAASHPGIGDGPPFTPAEIAHLILHGIEHEKERSLS